MELTTKLAFYALVSVGFVHGLLSGPSENDNSMVYKMINVPSAILKTNNTKQDLATTHPMICALHANLRSWCHLACFNEGSDICSLYDISLPPNSLVLDDDSEGFTPCFSNFPEGCIFGNHTYLSGESRMENCANMTCEKSKWIETPSDFVSVPEVGCVAVVELRYPFDEAKQHCKSLGARLVIPDNFEALRLYAVDHFAAFSYMMVGIYDDKWMDGREVEQWGEPNLDSGEICAWMHKTYDWTLYDKLCTASMIFMCQVV